MNATERYKSDPHYHAIVSTFYKMIAEGKFTPSELREASILAATMYEMDHVHHRIRYPPHVAEWM